MNPINETELSLYEKIKTCFSEPKTSKIKLLKLIFKYIVDTQCTENTSLSKISNKIKEDIVNCLIMAYIEIWLENDEYNKQSIDSYLKNIFQMQSQMTIIPESSPDFRDAIRREMYNGKSLIRTNISLQHKYSEEKNLVCKEPLETSDYGNKYTLLELEAFYKSAVEPLCIYKDIFKNKKPYHTTNRNAISLSYDIAEQDIADYNAYLGHIKSLINKNDNRKATKNNKEFVVKCLFVWKQERTYRYKLTAMLAKYLCDKRYDIDSIHIPDTIKHYYSTYPDVSSGDKINVYYSYFIKNYDKIISGGFSNKNKRYRDAILIARVCFNRCFSIICQNTRTTTLLGSWDDKDFEDVARFMIDEYGIKECLEMPNMEDVTTDGVSPYSYIRKLFEIPDYIDANQIAYYKEKSKEKIVRTK